MFPAKFENSWSDLNAGDLVLDPCLHFSKDTESGTSSSSACHSALKRASVSSFECHNLVVMHSTEICFRLIEFRKLTNNGQ